MRLRQKTYGINLTLASCFITEHCYTVLPVATQDLCSLRAAIASEKGGNRAREARAVVPAEGVDSGQFRLNTRKCQCALAIVGVKNQWSGPMLHRRGKLQCCVCGSASR